MKKLKLIGLLAAILALAFTFAACNNGAGGGATGVGDYDDMVITGKNAKNETVITRFSTDRKIERVALTQLETGDRYVMTVAGNEVSRGTIAVSNGIYVTFRPTSGAEFSGVVSGGSLSSLSGAGMPGDLAGFKTTKPASGGGGGYNPTPPTPIEVTAVDITVGQVFAGAWPRPAVAHTATPANGAVTLSPKWYSNADYEAENEIPANENFSAGSVYLEVTVTATGVYFFNSTLGSSVTITGDSPTVSAIENNDTTFTVRKTYTAAEAADPATALTAVTVTATAPVYAADAVTGDVTLVNASSAPIPFTASWVKTEGGTAAGATFDAGTAYSLKITVNNAYTLGTVVVTCSEAISSGSTATFDGTAKTITIPFAATDALITGLAITGVVAPVKDENPGAINTIVVTATPNTVGASGVLTHTDDFTIAWKDDQDATQSAAFDEDGVYSLTITVTAPTGYVFASTFAAGVVTINTTNTTKEIVGTPGATAVIKFTFPAAPASAP